MGEVDDVVGPLADQLRVEHGPRVGAEDTEWLVPDLPAVAVGAVQEVPTPSFVHARQVGDSVPDAGGDEQATSHQGHTVVEADGEAGPAGRRHVGDRRVDDLDAVLGDLGATDRQEFRGCHPVPGQVALHVGRRGIPGLPGIDHRDPAAGTSEHECGGQTGGSATDDYDVIRGCLHGSAPRRALCTPRPRLTTVVAVRARRRDRYLEEHAVPPRVGTANVRPRAAPASPAARAGPTPPVPSRGRMTIGIADRCRRGRFCSQSPDHRP